MKFTLLCLLLLTSLTAQAEVYRWTDSSGKVHFGDNKPNTKAENITDKVKQTNVDTSSAEHQKMEALFRKENDADREYEQAQAQPSEQHARACADAKEHLRKSSGRVQFLDDQGNPMNVSEDERKKHVAEIRKLIADNCTE